MHILIFFWNEKYDILFPKLEKLISKIETSPINKVNNKMDAAMSLHQILVTATGLLCLTRKFSYGVYGNCKSHW